MAVSKWGVIKCGNRGHHLLVYHELLALTRTRWLPGDDQHGEIYTE